MFGFCKSNSTIPIAHLDYKYISECNNAKELEKLLKILRSGEEGHYPDLVKYTEKKLDSLSPQSKLLQKETKVKSFKELDKNESSVLMDDLLEWSSQMSHVDKEILEGPAKPDSVPEYPPIRVSSSTKETKNNLQDKSSDIDSRRQAAPRSYTEWDKLNVEKELKDVDKVINKSPSNETRINDTAKSVPAKVEIPADSTESDKAAKANQEKNKGNEAFKAGDFNEALVYYNRSIFLQQSPVLFNNRAITYIKLERFEDAIKDCNKVLAEEPDNFKAFLRRGIALKSLKRFKQALHDFKTVLELAPTNKRAQSLADEVRKSLKETGNLDYDASGEPTVNGKDNGETAKGKRLIIEEIESINQRENEKFEAKEEQPVRKGKRLKIVEVENAEDISSDHKKENPKNGDFSPNSQSVNVDAMETAKSNESQGKDNLSTGETAVSEKANSGSVAMMANEEQDLKGKDVTSNATQAENPSNVNKESGTVHKELVPVAVLPVPEDVLSLKNDGNSLYKDGRFAEARDKYSAAIDKLGKGTKGHEFSVAVLLSNRAMCSSKIGDCKGCIKDATESIKLSPTAKAFLRRASAYETIENYRYAYVDYQTAVSFDNALHAGWSGISRLTNLLRNRDGAGWREKLPKSESYANLQKLVSGSNGQEAPRISSGSAPVSSNAQIPEAKSGSPKVPKMEVDINQVEAQFRNIKEKGNQFVQKKMFEDAVNCYTQCIGLLPNEVACYTNRSLCYLKLNKPLEAETDATKALSLQKDNIKALFRRASARKMLNRYADAMDDLSQLLECDKSNMPAKKELEIIKKLQNESCVGEVSRDETKTKTVPKNDTLQDKEESGNTIYTKEKLVEEIRNAAFAEQNAGPRNVAEKKGKRLKIIEIDELNDINKLADNNKEEDKISFSGIEKNDRKDTLLIETESETFSGNSSFKGSVYESLLSFEGIHVADSLEKLIAEGERSFNRGSYADGTKHFTRAIDSILSGPERPKSLLAGLYQNRGICEFRAGDSKSCVDDVTESLNYDVKATSYVLRAIALESLERYRDAYVDYMTALRKDSSIKMAWDASTRLIDILRNQDGPRWRDKLPKQNEPEPERRGNQEDRSEDRHGPLQQQGKRTEIEEDQLSRDEAVLNPEISSDKEQIKSAKKSESRQERFRKAKELGNKCALDGNFQEAAAHYSHCIDLFPEEATSLTNRALCYLKLNKLKKAENDCTKALDSQPDNIKALFRRALARKTPGKYKEALQDLTALLKLDPQNGAAKKELETIKDLWREELKNLASKTNEKNGTAASQQKPKKGAKIEEIPTKVAGSQPKEGTACQKESNQGRTGKESMQRSPRKFHLRKATGFEFLKAWNELKGKSLKEHADLLSQIEPSQLPKVISNKIDGEMIQTIVSCVHEFFMTKDKLLQGFNILRYTGKADRFNMGIMFLSTKDLSNIRRVIEDFEGKLKDSNSIVSAKEISELKKAYKVS
ncbi:sperm-associated antigen 1-like [Rhopilema esculentum]|uniref:sperm-associated antigen 1-like n=1 Tax=Rhopilema esculentum TaxID=499914 RepID=UPI0031D74A03